MPILLITHFKNVWTTYKAAYDRFWQGRDGLSLKRPTRWWIRRAIGTMVLVVTLETAIAPSASATTRSVVVAEDAAVLYYNSPASIQAGAVIYVGYASGYGAVKVATVNINGDKVDLVTVHTFETSDDHSAPAISVEASGSILVATAHHSSDLYLYRVTNRISELLCVWNGAYTYPRFFQSDQGLRLLVRSGATNAGHLAIIASVPDCTNPTILHEASQGDWIYAAPPQGAIAWNVYNERTKTHSGVFIDGQRFPIRKEEALPQTMVWSVSPSYLSIVHFEAPYGCCHKGGQLARVYDRNGGLVAEQHKTTMPYYPNGITLNAQGDEGLFPAASGGFVRRAITSGSPRPGCPSAGRNDVLAQYVRNGNGSYIWVAFDAHYSYIEFSGSRVMLCMVGN